MKDLKFKVCFKYEGIEPKGFRKRLIENAYVQIYNKYCGIVNPLLDGWNNLYTGPNDGGEPGSQYDSYIREKEMGVIDMINTIWINGGHPFGIKEFFAGEECDFRARLDDGTVMQMYLMKV